MKYKREDFVECLVEHEGYRKHVYKDTLGIDTVGIGRNLEDRGITAEELAHLDIPNIDAVYEHGLEYADAVYLACNDIEIVEEELLRHHSCVSELSATRQMVLMDMAFNMGVPRLLKFKKMWAAIHEGDFDAASREMLDSRWAVQVGTRSQKAALRMRIGEESGKTAN